MLGLLRFLIPKDEREHWIMDVNINFPDTTENYKEEEQRAIQQKDFYNCGVFACTNALLLAFGYDLKCFGRRDLDQTRKPRMVAEFKNGGMGGLYNYDVLEIPETPPPESQSVMKYRKLLEIHRAKKGVNLLVQDGESDSSGNVSLLLSFSSSDSNEEDEDEEDEDEDNNEVRGLEDIEPAKSPLPIFPTASQCLAIDNIINVIRPESIKRPLDPQYEATYGFVYPFYHIDFDEAVKCSKNQMIEACIKFPIANYQTQTSLPKEDFLDWMMNEMGATMSRIHNDPTPPFPGMGDGYETWLKWQETERKDIKLADVTIETSNSTLR